MRDGVMVCVCVCVMVCVCDGVYLCQVLHLLVQLFHSHQLRVVFALHLSQLLLQHTNFLL